MTTENWELKILVTVALLFSLVYSQAILFPLLLAFFIYLLLDPIAEWMVQYKVPRFVSALLLIGLLIGIMAASITFLLAPANKWIENAPGNFKLIEHKVVGIKKSLGTITEVADKAQKLTEIGNKNTVKVVAENSNLGFSLFGMTTNILLLVSTILLLVFFFLNYFKTIIENLESILTRKAIIKESNYIYSLKNKVSDYLFFFSLICVGLGFTVALSFWIIGMPNPVFFGFMATILTFVPYIGHFFGLCVTFFIALISFDSFLNIIAPPLLYFFLALIEGQIVTPILLGRHLNLNPLMVFLNMLIWSGLWGTSGLLISIPMLITIKMTFENIPSLAKFALLLEK